ncbi:MAG: hypothetical protein H6839_02720 [Planctomycetes bacterium]|nr:hypothetical protein [Planctomycetota bacterium]
MGVGTPLEFHGLSAGMPFLPLNRMTLARKSVDGETFDEAFLQRMVHEVPAIVPVHEYFLGST